MDIKIGGKAGCGMCKRVTTILTDKDIYYEYIDIGLPGNRQFLQDAMNYGIRALPIIKVDGEYKPFEFIEELK